MTDGASAAGREPVQRPPRRVALLGSGVIGGGWAARFLIAGVDVALFDPAASGRDTALAALARGQRAWRRLTPVDPPPVGELTIAPTVEAAVAGAALVQESVPEREELKAELLATADDAAPAEAIIASSTSGLLPSRLAAGMRHPERFVVGHPFNPVYLLPLVEVCGCDRTTDETVQRATAIYRAVGMRPLIVRREIDGFIADRLLEALWREALWLVADDVATVEEIDDAIRYGPGLRWSAMGTFLTYRLAGGEAGMRHFMAQFGPALALPWTRLTDVPELDERLLDTLVAQSDAQAGRRSIDELVRIRDDCLVAVLGGLREQGFAAGEEVARTEWRWRRARDATLAGDGDRRDAGAAPVAETRDGSATRDGDGGGAGEGLRLHEATVVPAWIDYNGHMTEYRYLQVLADATDAFLALIGARGDYVAAGHSYYSVESHLRHTGQARVGDRLVVDTLLLGHDDKRLHLFHELRRAPDGAPVATGEHMLVHVDTTGAAARAAAADPSVLAAVRRVAADRSGGPAPDLVGRGIDGERLRGRR